VAPLDRRDHRAYYNYITVWLDESPLLNLALSQM